MRFGRSTRGCLGGDGGATGWGGAVGRRSGCGACGDADRACARSCSARSCSARNPAGEALLEVRWWFLWVRPECGISTERRRTGRGPPAKVVGCCWSGIAGGGMAEVGSGAALAHGAGAICIASPKLPPTRASPPLPLTLGPAVLGRLLPPPPPPTPLAVSLPAPGPDLGLPSPPPLLIPPLPMPMPPTPLVTPFITTFAAALVRAARGIRGELPLRPLDSFAPAKLPTPLGPAPPPPPPPPGLRSSCPAAPPAVLETCQGGARRGETGTLELRICGGGVSRPVRSSSLIGRRAERSIPVAGRRRGGCREPTPPAREAPMRGAAPTAAARVATQGATALL